jgi:hypothetical protein
MAAVRLFYIITDTCTLINILAESMYIMFIVDITFTVTFMYFILNAMISVVTDIVEK